MLEAAAQSDPRFRSWEKALIAASAALFVVALALYVADFGFLTENVSGTATRVGSIAAAEGNVKRQFTGAETFAPIITGEPVFAGDLLVTGPDAKAVVNLGTSQLEVEPGSMIRLAFDSGFSLAGISRFTGGARRVNVDVVAGGVLRKSGQVRLLERGRVAEGRETAHVDSAPFIPAPPLSTAPEVVPPPVPEEAPRKAVAPERVEAPAPVVAALPSVVPVVAPVAPALPSPVPVVASKELRKVRFLEPKGTSRIRVADGSARAEAVASVKWFAEPPGLPLQMSLHKLTRLATGEVQREQVFTQDLVTGKAPGKVTHAIDAPGDYEWELRAPGGESLASAGSTTHAFTVEPQYVGVHVENPLVGGEESVSNRLRERIIRNFDVRLRWKAVPDAESYDVWIASKPDAKKALLEKQVGKETSLSLNKGKVMRGRLYYRVRAHLSKGYVAVSPTSALIFDFLPPSLVGPIQGEAVKRKSLTDGSIVFTWEATNFTEAYFFELSSDPTFSKNVEMEKVEENFRVGPAPKPGRWYWRVKSLGQEVESAPSKPAIFQID